MAADFDLRALHAALDGRRTALGLSWTALAAELGVSAATLRGLGARRAAEGDGVLRALYEALEAARAAHGLTWEAVAAASGAGSAAALTRLRAGGRVTFPEVMRALAWLGAPAARFVRAGNL